MPAPDVLITNVERVVMLRSFAGFAGLPPTELAVMAQHMERRYYPAGAVLAREGERVTTIHFIVAGAVEVHQHGHFLDRFGTRSAVGGVSYLARQPRGPEIMATEDTVTLDISTDDMEDLFEDNFTMVVSVLRAIARTILERRRSMDAGGGFPTEPDGVSSCPARPLDLVERIFFLRKTINFARTRIEALAQLARHAVELRVPAGTVLWNEGDRPDRVLFPVCGWVAADNLSGQRFVLGEGSSVGGVDGLADEPRWFTATAATDLVALQLPNELFLDVLEDDYEMARDFMASMAASLLDLMERASGHDHLELEVVRS